MFLFLLILLFIQCIYFSLDENVFYQMILRLSYLAVFYQMYFFYQTLVFLSDVAIFHQM